MKVLIIDDEKNIRESIQRILSFEDIDSDGAESAEDGIGLMMKSLYDAVIVDLKMPGMSGIELIEWMNKEAIQAPAIMISAHGDIDDAVAALKTGAKDYLVKPFDPSELIIRLKEQVTSSKNGALLEVNRRTKSYQSKLIGESAQIRYIRRQIEKIAVTKSTVLITGESGTGKEVVAREIHRKSAERDEPFIDVNLGGLPDALIESELFGHEKGSFTGADSRKTGLFELAGNGTLFLDEIGEMNPGMQVKILRVLQERNFRRLGGTRTIPMNARVLAATNRNLEEMVKNGDFREDLYYRINVIRISIPPLKERPEDLPLLIDALLAKVTRKMGLSGVSLSPGALSLLISHDFPGNVRELENLLERAVIYSDRKTIAEKDIDVIPQDGPTGAQSSRRSDAASAQQPSGAEHSGTLQEREKETIVRALEKWNGNRTKAARELGISRRTIINKIQRYAIK